MLSGLAAGQGELLAAGGELAAVLSGLAAGQGELLAAGGELRAVLSGLAAGQGELLAAMRALAVVHHAPVRQVPFSKASTTLAAAAMTAVGLGIGGRLALPADLPRYMPPGELAPFEWATGGGDEKQEAAASPTLLGLLEGWVRHGAEPPVTNLFLDVRTGPLMRMEVEGVADFTGLPDAIVAWRGIESPEEAQPYTAAAAFSVNWKRRSVMAGHRGQVAATARVQTLAMASTCAYTHGQPVFFTDLATGFRCWLVLDSKLYCLHGADADLSLAQGVALMRYLLARSAQGDALRVVDQALTSSAREQQREVGPRVPAPPVGGAGRAAAQPALGGSAGGGGGGGGGGRAAASKSRGAGAVDDGLGSPESEDTVGDDGVDVDFRTLALSIARDLARGGGFSLEDWLANN